jgi:ribosomal protein S1
MAKRRGIIAPIPHDMDVFEAHEMMKLNKKGIITPSQQALLKGTEFDGKIPSVNTIVNAKFVNQTDRYFYLDAGYKDFIQVPRRQTENAYFSNFQIGENVDVNIDIFTETPFYVEGSVQTMYERNAKHMLLTLQENGEPLQANILAYHGGGYSAELDVNGIKFSAFMPTILADVNKVMNPEELIGRTFEVLVDNENSDDNHTLVVSRRAYLESLIPERIKTLEKGHIYSGVVTGATTFGVFVQFEDYLTGMIHKSNIREDLRDILIEIPSGIEIAFYIKDIIEQRDGKFKIMLTQYIDDSINSLIDSLKVGMVREGEVIQVHHYGALVAFDEDTKGLIPIVEMEHKKVNLQPSQKVKVKIQEIERKQRKMTLSIEK